MGVGNYNEELPEDEAEFNPATGLLRLRNSVFRAANDPFSSPREKARARFTIMHEAGHALLGHKRTRHRNISDRKIEKIILQTRIDEAEANRFSGAFLVPPELVDIAISPTPQQISREFQVSMQMAEIRLNELETLARRKSNTKRETPDFVLDYLREAKKRGSKVIPNLTERDSVPVPESATI